MRALAIAICVTVLTASGACAGENLVGCVHREIGCSWLEQEGQPPVSLEGKFSLPAPACPFGWGVSVEGENENTPVRPAPSPCSANGFGKYVRVRSLGCADVVKSAHMSPCETRVTLERWIIDNKEYLERCFDDQTGKGPGPNDEYRNGCDGRNAKELYDKLVDLILTDRQPLVRRFDEIRYHIVCTDDHCDFTHSFVPSRP
jgi:hypothetical protein